MLGANPNRFKRGKSQCRGCGVTRTGISGTIMALSVQITDYRRKTMNSLKDITDDCRHCENIFTCELCKQGHGIKQERSNVSKMIG